MNKRYFLKLVRGHVNGTATLEELRLLTSYYTLFETEPDVIALLNDEKKLEIKNRVTYVIHQVITTNGETGSKIRSIRN